MQKMSGQGVRTHHRKAAKRRLWCYVRKCRVLLPKRVPDGKHHSFHSDGKHHSFHPDGNSHSFHLDVSQPQFYPANVLPYPHVSQPPFYPDDFPPSRIFHIWRLTPDGRGGRFKFPGQTYPDPLIALTWRASTTDISDYPDFCTVPRFLSSQSNSEDFSSEDERLDSLSLGVKKAGYLLRACEGKSKVKDHLEWQMLGPQSRDTGWTRIKWHHCQVPLRGHESAETPIGNKSNGAVAGDGATLHCACHIEYEIAEEAMNFMSYVAKVSRGWDEPNAQNMGRMKFRLDAKGEMYILNDVIHMKAKIATMARRLEELEMTKMQEVQAISQTPLQAMPCAICLSYEHLEPQPPQYQQPAQALQQALNLEQAMMNLSKVVGDFVGTQKSINTQLSQRIDSVESSLNKKMDVMQNDLSQKIDNLQYSISRFANLNTVQEKGNSPSQPYQNSKGIHEVEAQKGESSMVKEVEAVITLRSGKEVDMPTSKLKHEVESEIEKEKSEEIKGKKKGKRIEKDDYDVNIQEKPQRIVIKEEFMKKHMHPLFPKLCMEKSYRANLK
ncbi:hypothetical protein CK203_101655 [Vitis vinifera]|uniref:Uncharacterized protein n=1 Tax=Vitis vinifera TaxID=29760 RepID=A0A438D1X9_VITVI|nr:hypothetical protein CK203_101655 [Vitis vinifera]